MMKFFRSINERVLFKNFEKVENNFIDLYTVFVELKIIEKSGLKIISLYTTLLIIQIILLFKRGRY